MVYSNHFLQFVDYFNRGDYRACVEPLEELWFVQRDDFHKGLIRLVVGLNQMKLGLESGPRFLLKTARELLAPYGPHHGGIDLAALDAFAARQEALVGTAAAAELERFAIRLDPPAEQAATPKETRECSG